MRAGELALILPAVTRQQVHLVPLAALGLAAVMLDARVEYLSRGSFATTGPLNVVIRTTMLFLAWRRGRRAPLTSRVA